MKDSIKILLGLFLFFISINTVSAREKVAFSKCVDGDTIKVLIGNEEKTIRLIAVDTPESVSTSKGIEYYGKEASNYTCNSITNAKKIELEYEKSKTDKYGRMIAWVWIDDILLQDELIKGGYAEVAYLYGKYKYVDILKDHQAIAVSSKIGIWNEEKRKEYDIKTGTDSSTKKESTNNEDSIDFENMSTKEIIIIIVVLVIVILFGPTIKKIKRRIKRYIK